MIRIRELLHKAAETLAYSVTAAVLNQLGCQHGEVNTKVFCPI